ncbi:MAG: phage major capsid protein [Planctomycetota bacterium]|jgi:hypothetical protein
MSTADVTKATRELFDRTLVDQVNMRVPVVEALQRNGQVKSTFKGGKYIEKLIDTDTIHSEVQEYTVNSALVDSKKTTLEKPRFTWKYATEPLRYDVDEEVQNANAGKEEQLLDLPEHLVKKAHKDLKQWMEEKIFNSGSATGVADGATAFQSFVSALDADVTYGTITRTAASNIADYWQGADPAGLWSGLTASTQGTAANATLSNIRKWVNESDVAHYMDGADDLMLLCCPTIWNKLAAEMESKLIYKPGLKQSQGIRSMIFDGHEIVSVPYLQTSSTMKTWFFIINLRHWEWRMWNERDFKFTGFKWQGENSNGYDYWLARVMMVGNFFCWKPNSSMWLSNVS